MKLELWIWEISFGPLRKKWNFCSVWKLMIFELLPQLPANLLWLEFLPVVEWKLLSVVHCFNEAYLFNRTSKRKIWSFPKTIIKGFKERISRNRGLYFAKVYFVINQFMISSFTRISKRNCHMNLEIDKSLKDFSFII
jgi:hypothetical protein